MNFRVHSLGHLFIMIFHNMVIQACVCTIAFLGIPDSSEAAESGMLVARESCTFRRLRF
jgi:hypothetical protein